MTKLELIEEIAKRCGLTKKKAGEVVDAFCDVVREGLKKGDEVRIVNFGVWKVVEKKEREGINPRTGEKIKIPGRKAVKFVSGKALEVA